MLSALLSFLGGTAFRMIWGELSAYFTRRQEHAIELERLKLQAEHAAAEHARQLESIRLQHDLGVQLVRVQADADTAREEAAAWRAVAEGTTRASGVWFVDLWNGVIRPLVATWAIVLVSGNYLAWWRLDEMGWQLAGAALGLYLADRTLFKRGK